MSDASRFPQGIVINGVLTTARPVGTIVRDTVTGGLFVSTNAAVATYAALGGTTNVLTSVVSAADTLVGSVIGAGVATPFSNTATLLANTIAAGSRVRIRGSYGIASGAGATTVALVVFFGATQIADILTATAATTGDACAFETLMTFGSAGAAAQIAVDGWQSALGGQQRGPPGNGAGGSALPRCWTRRSIRSLP